MSSSTTPPSRPLSGNISPTTTTKKPVEKGSFAHRQVSVVEHSEPQLKRSSRQKRKGRTQTLSRFSSVKPFSPRFKYSAQVKLDGQHFKILSNTPNVNVWTGAQHARVLKSNIPNIQMNFFEPKPYRGNPFQIEVPSVGIVQLQQPIACSHPNVQTHRSRAPQKAVHQHIYQDAAARHKISQSRVKERFHMPDSEVAKLQTLSEKESTKATSFKPRTLEAAVAKRKSADYQFLNRAINVHKKNMSLPLPNNKAGIEKAGRPIINNIENGMRTIDTIMKTGSRYFPKEELSRLSDLRQQLNSERSLALQVMTEKGAANLGKSFSWQSATDFKRVGYELTADLKPYLSALDDSKLAKPEEPFGKGMMHTVSRLTFKEGDSTVSKIFKAEDAIDRSAFQTIAKGKYLNAARPKFAIRNIAAQNLQKHIGVDLLPKMELTTHNGRVGLLMDQAKGTQPYQPKTGVVKGLPLNARAQPEKAAELQKNLVNAEWFDCLCGQQDRHARNYFIDQETGKVTLIDNDQAFYPGADDIAQASTQPVYKGWVSPWPGLPAMIDKHMYDKLIAMKPDDIQASLVGLLEPEEIQSTVSRYRKLKAHAQKLQQQGLVVEDWANWKSQTEPPLSASDYLQKYGSRQSYFNTLKRLQQASNESAFETRNPPRNTQPKFHSAK